jgi:predicted house-cleaning noncanonical NTP pyrophosphatase (MazG superfamily)
MMHKFLQNKLWRDKAPNLMRATGSIVRVIHLDDAQYEEKLKIKLQEEVEEVCVAKDKKELIEELADVFEVVDALCALHKISLEEVHAVQQEKRDKRGGFYERAFVTIAEHAAGSHGEQYCRVQPEKYPEIV